MTRQIKEALFTVAGLASGILMVAMILDTSFIPSLVFAMVFAVFFGTTALLSAPYRYAYLLSAVPFGFAGYLLSENIWLLIGVLIAALFSLISWFQIRRSEEVSVHFSVVKGLRSGLPLFFTSLALLGSLFFYEERSGRAVVEFIPRQAFDIFFPYFAGMVGTGEVKANSNDTIDQLIARLVEAEARETLGTNAVPPSYLDAFVTAQREALATQFDISLNGNEKAGDVFYTVANKKANEIAGPYIDYLPIAFSVGIFFALKALSLPIAWLAISLSFALVWLLRRFGLLHEVTQSVTITSYTL